MSNAKELKFLSWNADGVRTKLSELLDLAVSKLSIDIIALCETRLSPNSVISTPGYTLHRLDKHPNGHGQGVALLIKTDIEHLSIIAPKTRHMEVIGVEITSSNKRLTILSVYQSPNLPLDPSDIDNLLNIGPNVLMMGDFNSRHPHWFCRDSNTRGRLLFHHMLQNSHTRTNHTLDRLPYFGSLSTRLSAIHTRSRAIQKCPRN